MHRKADEDGVDPHEKTGDRCRRRCRDHRLRHAGLCRGDERDGCGRGGQRLPGGSAAARGFRRGGGCFSRRAAERVRAGRRRRRRPMPGFQRAHGHDSRGGLSRSRARRRLDPGAWHGGHEGRPGGHGPWCRRPAQGRHRPGW